MTDTSFYPEATASPPPRFHAVSGRYRLQVLLVLAYLGLVVLLYLALLGGAGYFFYRSLRYTFHPQSEALLGYAGVAGAALLLLLLGRPLFRRIKVDRSPLLDVRPASQPRLFEFLHRLCQEVAAPFPRKVYLSPEMNAAFGGQTNHLLSDHWCRRKGPWL